MFPRFSLLSAALALVPLASPAGPALDYLRLISGQHTIAGHHNDRKVVEAPFKWTDAIHGTTGRHPGLWSSDFSYDHRITTRWQMIEEAERQWRAGAVVNLMWHACPPTQTEPCTFETGIKSRLTDEQWRELTTPDTPLHRIWLERVDALVPYLRRLEARGVEVLFRPLHEMNQGAFWWGGRPGPDGSSKLYRITHDHLMRHHRLTNLTWVWNIQDLRRDFADYDPGDGYWDVMTLDVYAKSGFTQEKYEDALKVARGKPMGIGECDRLPTPAELEAQPRWTFFMGWAGLVHERNAPDTIRATYASPRVLTREKLPGWTSRTGP